MEQPNAVQDQRGQEAQEAIAFYHRLIMDLTSELRGPVDGIIGYLHLLLAKNTLYPDDRRMVERSVSLAGQLRRLVDHLAMSGLISGRLQLAPIDMQLRTLVDMVRTNMELDAKEKHLTLSMTVDAAIPDTIYHDQHRLLLIVSDLVSNSIKFSPENGQIDVTFQRVGDRMQIDVTDTSIALPAPVWERFVEAAQQDGISGPGLGLPLVIRLIRLMDGTFRVRSEAGLGNTFSVELPLELR